MRTHDWLDHRSLALDRIIADQVAAQPELLGTVSTTLERWIAARDPEPPVVVLEWRKRLRGSLPEISADVRELCRSRLRRLASGAT